MTTPEGLRPGVLYAKRAIALGMLCAFLSLFWGATWGDWPGLVLAWFVFRWSVRRL